MAIGMSVTSVTKVKKQGDFFAKLGELTGILIVRENVFKKNARVTVS